MVVDGFEKLAGRPDGTLTMMREIAKIAARKGSTTTRISTDGRFPATQSDLWWERASMDFSDRASATVGIRPWTRPSAPAAQFQAASEEIQE